MVAQEGHETRLAAEEMCRSIRAQFYADEYVTTGACVRDVFRGLGAARGLALAHDGVYASAVVAMEQKLAFDGYFKMDFETSMYEKPYRAMAVKRMAEAVFGPAGSSAPGRAYCETGFGAGHSALRMLQMYPDLVVISFDLGLAASTVQAHDYLDEKYPQRLVLSLGDSVLTVPRLPEYFPQLKCNMVYLDGSTLYTAIIADVKNFRSVSAPGAVVILTNVYPGSDGERAWMDLVDDRVLLWEGFIKEAPTVPSSDMILYGRFL